VLSRRTATPRIDGWSDPALARVATWLGDEAGLTFPANRRPGIEDALRDAMATLGARTAEELDAMVRASRDARELATAALTIGETYFFRDHEQLALLERVVFPALARRPGGQRRLRMWSAGCASGEEPYTLAMLAREAGWAQGVDVIGTDVAPARLATARRARYGRWSMRGVSPDRLARWFHAQGRHWTVDPEVARDVTFRMLNLADEGWPSLETGIGAMDLVLCRNVLIYFDAETIAGVARRLMASLAPDGWLFLGASDPMLVDLVPCEVVQTDAGLLYRPPGASAIAPVAQMTRVTPAAATPVGTPVAMPVAMPVATAVTPPIASSIASPPAWTSQSIAPVRAAAPSDVRARARAEYDAGNHESAADAALAAVDAGDADASTWTVLVRSLANLGRLREAGSACATALSHFPMEPGLLLMHATLLLADGRPADAAAAARRALYLDREAPMSHLLLGDALARAGDRTEARRAFRAAERLLDALPADATVPHADGQPAGRLLRVARYRATSMTDSGAKARDA
jgi:chemotaxis protein methyltransferase CheR